MQLFVCIVLIAQALALGLRKRESLISSSLGGNSLLYQARRDLPLRNAASPQLRQRGDFIFDNAVALQLSERSGPPLLPTDVPQLHQRGVPPHLEAELIMVHGDNPERSGMEDPEGFIGKRMPAWARWDPEVTTDPETGDELESDPCLWIRVTDAIRLDEDGGQWMVARVVLRPGDGVHHQKNLHYFPYELPTRLAIRPAYETSHTTCLRN